MKNEQSSTFINLKILKPPRIQCFVRILEAKKLQTRRPWDHWNQRKKLRLDHLPSRPTIFDFSTLNPRTPAENLLKPTAERLSQLG